MEGLNAHVGCYEVENMYERRLWWLDMHFGLVEYLVWYKRSACQRKR